jgi:hypothetical protein
MTGEKSRYVLEEDEPRSVPLGQSEEAEGESRSGVGGGGAVVAEAHAPSLPGDGEVLAGEAAGPEGGCCSTAGDQGIDAKPEPIFSGGDSVGCGA